MGGAGDQQGAAADPDPAGGALSPATDDNGRALDRVAHFHLGNGAVVERLNWLADTSANGFKQSYAMMVNYRYKLADVDANHEAYASGKIVASREVRALAKG